MDDFDNINSAYAYAQKLKREQKEATYEPPPTEEEARRVLLVLKNCRIHTQQYFAAILNNEGIGIFQPDKGRPFNRNLLFNKNEIAPILNVYTPSWLSEIRRCHLLLWSAADRDPDMEDLHSFIQAFKHEWEDFFQTLSVRFPDEAAGLISDFEYSGIEMFSNLESSIISGCAQTPDAESDIDVFEGYLPEVKKLFIKEAKQKNIAKNSSSNAPSPLCEKWETVDALINHLYETDKKKEQDHLKLLRKSFTDNWLFSNVNHDRPDAQPDFSQFINTIQSAIADLNKGKIRTPSVFCTWQLVLPLVLTYPTDQYDYAELVKDDDDSQTFSEVLASGERVYVHAYHVRHPLEPQVHEIQELTGVYLKTAFALARRIHSKSEDLWGEALGNFQRVNHAFRLSKNKCILEAMSQKMVEAASRLAIDLDFDIPPPKETPQGNLATTIVAQLREQPIKSCVVEVAPSAGKSLRAAMKDPGGRPSKSSNDHAANSFTQKRIAEMFGPPCTAEIISNWESRTRGGRRGSTPPSAKYKDRLVSYCAELRKFPIGENLEILAAIIKQYKATEGVKAATAKPKTIHCKSDETLARASGQIDEAIRERSHLKNGE